MCSNKYAWLGLGLVLAAGLRGVLMVGPSLSSVLPPAQAAPQDRPEPHPLDPLRSDEIASAVAVLKADQRFTEASLFPHLALNEPRKADVLGFRAGATFRREAFAVVLDRKANKTFEVVVDLREKKVTSWKEIPNVQPAVLIEEWETAAEIVRADERWRAAMRQRGIDDVQKVYLEAWAVGDVPDSPGKNARLLRVICFYRGDSANPYARPIEGVVALVNMNTKKMVELLDRERVPLAAEKSDFLDPKGVGPMREPPRPLEERQPRGPSFEVRGHEVRWQQWRFRFAMHPREGLVLYTVGYEDGDKVRPILYRGAMSEMLVPYGDPSGAWYWRNAFDEGEYGMGRLANPLRPGFEVPEHAALFDATFADDRGAAFTIPNAVALYEQDGGILWTHTDPPTRATATRRARELVLNALVTVGNYDYGVRWIFRQDASLELKLDLSGVLLAKGVDSKTCQLCKQQPDRDGKLRPEGEERYGTLVARNIVATNHQHLFCFRLDLDVDGVQNRAAELNVAPAPPGKDNPQRGAFVIEQTWLRTEKEARRDVSGAARRAWKVFNTEQLTGLGHYPAYMLEPGAGSKPFFPADTDLGKRAGFARHHVWVTRQRDSELYAAGAYPNQATEEDGLPRWIVDDESLENHDLVLWHSFGVTHIPRVEEWPVMPTEHAGFRLVPENFFLRTPALNVPPPASKKRPEKNGR